MTLVQPCLELVDHVQILPPARPLAKLLLDLALVLFHFVVLLFPFI